MSVIDPPETERKAAPEKPARNLVTMMVSMFCASAVGICHTTISRNLADEGYLRRRNMTQCKLVFDHKIQTTDPKTLSSVSYSPETGGYMVQKQVPVQRWRVPG